MIMKYYRLLDDLKIPGRWYLGEVINRLNGSALELWSGAHLDQSVVLEAQITRPGTPLDYQLTAFANPVVRKPIAKSLASIANHDLQLLPVKIGDLKDFYILNITRLIRCLDEQKSEFRKWTKDDFRSDLAGSYEWVGNLRIDVTQIPPDAHIFRIEGWHIAIIISEEIKTLMERIGCVGAKFQSVT